MHPSVLLAALPPTAVDDAAQDLASALCSQAPRLRRLVHRLLGMGASSHELDDLVQDVLLRAWRARASFRGDAALSTWLCRIATTTTASHVRRRALTRRLFGWLLPDVAAPAPATSHHDAHDDSGTLQTALARLRHDDREVLVLRYLENRAIPELAFLLGISRAAVDARLTRARSRLRALLPETER
ncbi:MAG: sigma-70 family RNA polymerase sigma factor [Planctomycetes bacterium]|nr:sigma-70 family RNA polymerase sigma factor [Planctomycetota bacterium]